MEVKPLSLPAEYIVQDECLIGKTGLSRFHASRKTGTAVAEICDELLRQPYLMRHQVINSMVYFLLTHRFLTPLHGSCFSIGDDGFICFGKSGAGKSTIAMGAMDRGFPLLAEDICFISGNQVVTVRGDCREVHLTGDSLERFPSLATLDTTATHNGKIKYIVPVKPRYRRTNIAHTAILFVEPNYSCRHTSIQETQNDDHFQSLYQPEEDGFNLFCGSRKKHIDFLSRKSSYLVKVGSDQTFFFEAVRRLCP